MANMGKYCKAYSIQKLREFKGWSEKPENARKEKQKGADGKETEVIRPLTDKDYLYLQENYVVTDGIYIDQNVIFDQVTPEWKVFCDQVLKFEIPDYARDTSE
ncbi:MAG: hypothetical protein EHM45_10580 [Desulfobacteraceae bacterium]|nr:MAG: hypothetical protein EHM45_10580 [Desulfobacteraceae bacterium]